jgi:hypothetical protein
MRNGFDRESNPRPQRRRALMLISNIDLTTAPLWQPMSSATWRRVTRDWTIDVRVRDVHLCWCKPDGQKCGLWSADWNGKRDEVGLWMCTVMTHMYSSAVWCSAMREDSRLGPWYLFESKSVYRNVRPATCSIGLYTHHGALAAPKTKSIVHFSGGRLVLSIQHLKRLSNWSTHIRWRGGNDTTLPENPFYPPLWPSCNRIITES